MWSSSIPTLCLGCTRNAVCLEATYQKVPTELSTGLLCLSFCSPLQSICCFQKSVYCMRKNWLCNPISMQQMVIWSEVKNIWFTWDTVWCRGKSLNWGKMPYWHQTISFGSEVPLLEPKLHSSIVCGPEVVGSCSHSLCSRLSWPKHCTRSLCTVDHNLAPVWHTLK